MRMPSQKELPSGLPPLQGIEHQIDFVAGSQLPNKPAYQSNPKDTKELQRQVEELINKGYVRQSLSPCVVPVLFVPTKDRTWRIKTMHDHVEHLRCVFDVLRKEQLYANLDKCSFYVDEVAFLGFVVSSRGVEVDESKIDAIKNWPIPKSISDIRSFHGLASLYRRFFKGFSTIAAPLIEVIQKDKPFKWLEELAKAF
ncbi:uncharacterized mitochondrial protein AtMg00860-like [Solanum tuberosum]|uniref:uncharacterized mitochondrial protein AtMg00860-like n=1 Tax=Solanum tuberosum TaxID=4113 RepID=UPI00073A413E|nr:PREDICTED: uncharacterized mitochondrial protein AtMg00860-like [Solanum tuberosum]